MTMRHAHLERSSHPGLDPGSILKLSQPQCFFDPGSSPGKLKRIYPNI